ncbi:sulfatase family protein [Zavarzinella formosa]|uniref:sulfatase family protein n=1 Tax=Zavarzinella formosa TaxID=360055 RepID=UPI0002F69703|nr:sulfatase [Zavarzinella formosa]
MRGALSFLLLVFTPVGLFAETAKKNIVLLIADDLGMEVGCYGDKLAQTPNIDALAKSGTRFTNGFASVSSCSPSRATILTGMPTHHCGQYGLAHATHNAHSFRDVRSIPRMLQTAGYRTGVISKLHVQPPEVYPWDAEMKTNGRNGIAIGNDARKFITTGGDKPFFLLVGFTDPHRAAKGFDMDKTFKGVPTISVDPKAVSLPYFLPDQPEVRSEMAEYYASVNRLDFGIGQVMNVLKETKHDTDTLVIFLSDNGIPFPGAKTTLYDSGIHLPLIIHAPGQTKAGVVNEAMASWTDVAPTILEYAGIKPPAAMLGKSLLPILSATDDTTRNTVFASHQFHEITMYYPMRAIRTRTHKLIVNLANPLPFPFASDLHGSEMWQGILKRNDTMMGQRSRETYEHRPMLELYDIVADPNELKNLANDPAQTDRVKTMRADLRKWQTATNDPWLIKDLHE